MSMNKSSSNPSAPPIEYTLEELLANQVEISEEVHWGKAEGREVW